MKNININELLDKFKGLNPKEYYAWPKFIQILLSVVTFLLILMAGVFFDFIPDNDNLEKLKQKEVKLKEDFISKKKQAINLVLYEKQLDDIIKDSNTLLKQLPNKSQIEQLIIDINQAGIGRGLKFELFKPEVEKMNEFYAELPINIKVSGTYDAIGNFTADISQLSRVVLFSDMDVSTKNGVVTLTAVAKTFRYLEQAELEEQAKKKQEEEKKKKKNKKSGA